VYGTKHSHISAPNLSSLLIIQSSCTLKLVSYSWPAHEAKLRVVGRGKKIDEAVEKDEDLVQSQVVTTVGRVWAIVTTKTAGGNG